MAFTGAEFPYNTRVVSKTPSTIVMSAQATGNGTTFTLYKRFEFEYPASRDEGEQIKANQTKTRSILGVTQTVTNYFEATRDLEFGFVTKTSRDELRDDFGIGWALLGKAFRYFDDKAVNAFVEYESVNGDFTQNRQIKKHPDYLYSLRFRFRRVL